MVLISVQLEPNVLDFIDQHPDKYSGDVDADPDIMAIRGAKCEAGLKIN